MRRRWMMLAATSTVAVAALLLTLWPGVPGPTGADKSSPYTTPTHEPTGEDKSSRYSTPVEDALLVVSRDRKLVSALRLALYDDYPNALTLSGVQPDTAERLADLDAYLAADYPSGDSLDAPAFDPEPTATDQPPTPEPPAPSGVVPPRQPRPAPRVAPTRRPAPRLRPTATPEPRVARNPQGGTLAQYRTWIEEARQRYPYPESTNKMWRVMICESDGIRGAVNPNGHYGIFQYAPATWDGNWNPYRDNSIYDPRSQIFATALAWKYGLQHWWECYYLT